MTTMLSGMWSSVRPPVESMTAGQSLSPGMPGSTGLEPTAMIILSGRNSLPPAVTVLGPVKRASPSTTLILFARISTLTPPVSLSETDCLVACTCAQSTATSLPMMPIPAEPVASS